jgi:hypothetical protein
LVWQLAIILAPIVFCFIGLYPYAYSWIWGIRFSEPKNYSNVNSLTTGMRWVETDIVNAGYRMRGNVTLFYISPQSYTNNAWCYIATSSQYEDFDRSWKRTYDLVYNGPPITSQINSIALSFDLLMNDSSRYYFGTAASDVSGMQVSLEIEDRGIPSSWIPIFVMAGVITLVGSLPQLLRVLAQMMKKVRIRR